MPSPARYPRTRHSGTPSRNSVLPKLRAPWLRWPGGARTLWTHLGRALLLLWLLPAAAQAQIGTPIDLGSSEADLVTSTSLSITTSQAAPAGATIIVIANLVALGAPLTTADCSDNAGNAYHTDASNSGIPNALTSICSTPPIAAQLNTSSTITVTWSGGTARFKQRVHAFAVTGLASSALDNRASASGSSTSPACGAITLTTQANELLFGVILAANHNVASAGFSPGTNAASTNCAATGTDTYTSLGGVGTTPPALFGMYCVVSARAIYAAQATTNITAAGPPDWEALLVTYKAAPPPTTLTVDVNPATAGQAVTFRATMTGGGAAGTPTGTVTFKDGSTTLGTGTLNGSGVATFATSSLSVGIHSMTAVYGGDSNFPGSTSSPLNEVINPPPPTALTVTANPTSLTLTSGQSGTVALTITGNGSSAVTVNCFPVTVTCSVSTPVVGTSLTTATLTITAATTLAANTPPASSRSGQLALVLFGTVMPFGMVIIRIRGRNRNKLDGRTAIKAGLGLLLLIIIFSIGGCGGGNARPGAPVPPGTYSVAVTATSGSLSGGTNVSVTVH